MMSSGLTKKQMNILYDRYIIFFQFGFFIFSIVLCLIPIILYFANLLDENKINCVCLIGCIYIYHLITENKKEISILAITDKGGVYRNTNNFIILFDFISLVAGFNCITYIFLKMILKGTLGFFYYYNSYDIFIQEYLEFIIEHSHLS